jgi:hypothetical protein
MFSSVVLSQSMPYYVPKWVSPAEKNKIERAQTIANLDSSDYETRLGAALDILIGNIPEAVPKLEEKIAHEKINIAIFYLHSLSKYGSANTLKFAHLLMNELDTATLKSPPPDRLSLKVDITEILFNHNDFSTAKYIFELIDRDSPQIPLDPVYLLQYVIKYLPEYKEQAKQELIKTASVMDEALTSRFAITSLMEYFPQESVPVLENVFLYHKDYSNRKFAFMLLTDLDDPNLNSLVKKEIITENVSFNRLEFLQYLLFDRGTPEDYLFVKNLLKIEHDQSVFPTINENITNFNPPNLKTSINGFIDTLISYTTKSYIFNWIGNANYFSGLITVLRTAKQYLENVDSLSVLKSTKLFQNLIRQGFKDSLDNSVNFATVDAYKFLNVYSQDLIDRLSKSKPDFVVKLVNSNGNTIPGGSLKYFDRSWAEVTENRNGIFFIYTNSNPIELKMTYENTSQFISCIPKETDTVVFKTIKVTVRVKDIYNNPLDSVLVSYLTYNYTDMGFTSGGIITKELLPDNRLSFYVRLGKASKNKRLYIQDNSLVEFTLP